MEGVEWRGSSAAGDTRNFDKLDSVPYPGETERI